MATMTKKELTAFKAMTPEQQDEWIKGGAPDAVLTADRKLVEGFRPTIRGVAVGPRCETYTQARALAAAILAEMLAPDLPPKEIVAGALTQSGQVVQ